MINQITRPNVLINYQLEESGIFRIIFSGKIPVDNILSFLDDFYLFENLPNELILLYDFTRAEFDLDPVKIKILSAKAMEVSINYDKIRTAFVVAEPKVTAYTMLFSMMIPNEKATREIFSTVEAAEDWLIGNR